jgi:tetratricopeptide (TPR) repeat protein
VGAGAKWEGAIVTQQLYEAEGAPHKFIPVILSTEDIENIPLELRGSPYYVLDSESGYEALYRRLTDQPEVIKQQLGKLRSLRPRERKQNFFNVKEEAETQSEPPESTVISEEMPAVPAVKNARSSAGLEPLVSVSSQGTPPPGLPSSKSRFWGIFTRHGRKFVMALVVLLAVLSAVYLFWPRKRIAIMPFPVESSDRDLEHISGITTDFLERSLSRVPQLSIHAHDSVFYFKNKRVSLRQIGEELNVQALVTGSIRQHENRLSVDVAVADARTEEILWSKSYEDELTNLPSLQSQIARDVSTYFSPRLSDADRQKVAKNDTLSYEALELYSQGNQFWRDRNLKDDNLDKAIKKFEQATEIDAHYAQAYIGLANCYVLLEDFTAKRATVTIPKAEENVKWALDLDDSLAEAHASKGFILFNKWDWDGAEKEFKRASELNPDYSTTYQWYSILLRTVGGARYDEALTQIKKAEKLDKLSDTIISNLGVYYLSKGDADNAVDQFERMLKLSPDSTFAQSWLAMAYAKQGRKDAALAALQKGVNNPPSSGDLEFVGYINAVAGDKAKAADIARQLEILYDHQKAIAFNVAVVYAGLGDNDKAIQWLRTAYDDHSGDLPFMRMPMFESLRSDPRYNDLLRQIKLIP